MKQDQLNQSDSFIDEIRDTGTKETMLVNRLGFYKASEADRYIASLEDQLHSTKIVYQDRFEEMRTSLLGMTRERDEKIHQLKDFEKKLAEASDWQSQMSAQNMVGIPADELEQMRQMIDKLTSDVVQLRETKEQLTQENEALRHELENIESNYPNQTAVIDELRQTRASLKIKTDEYDRLSSDAQSQRQRYHELQLDLEKLRRQMADQAESVNLTRTSLEARIEENSQLAADNRTQRKFSEELRIELECLRLQVAEQSEQSQQIRTQYQLLDTQYKIGQDMVSKLLAEKTALENEIRNQQQRWEIQRDAMLTRFQSGPHRPEPVPQEIA